MRCFVMTSNLADLKKGIKKKKPSEIKGLQITANQ